MRSGDLLSRETSDAVAYIDSPNIFFLRMSMLCAAVKISGIVIKSVLKPDQAPAKVRLFANKPTIGFGDAASLAPVQGLQLDSKTLSGETIPLKQVPPSLHPSHQTHPEHPSLPGSLGKVC